ncbi:MAG: ABC transporter substrate-binding protein [Vicinamibacterales bacterium]
MAALPAGMRLHRAAAALAIALAILAVACGTDSGTPRSESPATPVRPERIVSLVPATTEILFAIGAGDRVVGVGSYDRFPPEAGTRPKVGGLIDPDTERILALRPDLVVGYATQDALIEQLDRASVPFYSYRHRALPDVMQTIRDLGTRVDEAEAASRLADRMQGQLESIRSSVANRPRPTVLLVFGRDPGGIRNVYASGGYGFLADVLDIAGGDNVFADVERESVQVGTEELLSLRPDVIVELQYDGSDTEPALRRPEDWNSLPSIPAVRDGRVHILRGDEFVVPGPRVVDAARRLADVLHPAAQ